MSLRLAAFMLLAVLCVASEAMAQSASPAVTFVPCQIGAADSPDHLPAKCTTLTVPEDRAHPAGHTIGLHIAVLPARASHPAPDPLFYIAGGPGQAATEAFVQQAAAFDRLREQHDIVLVDQRGTGQSNRLDCPTDSNSETGASTAEIAAAVQRCLKHLPGDPRYYTTSVAVEDLDAARAALGYDTLDLYGVSYGTRVALQYLRAYPAHVRSVVLDGVVPADLNLGPGISLDAQRALQLIFSRCSREADCRHAFPDPAADFAALQRQLDHHAVTVTLRDPLIGAPRVEDLTWDQAAGAVRIMSYQSETASLLPLLIHQAAAQRDYAPLMSTALIFAQEIKSGFAQAMSASVLCTEDVPFYGQDADRQTLRDTYLGAVTVDNLVNTCRFWPRGVMAKDFKQPVVSGKPVLLLSGEDDPITPPANAAHAAKTLANSLSLVVPGQGHGNVFRGCVPKLVAQFVAEASVQGLDTSCVKTIRPFPFFTRFTGPEP